MDGVAISVECNRAVIVPLHQKCPQVWVVLSQETKLANALVVAEPATVTHGCCISGCKHIHVCGLKPTQILVPSDLNQWKNLILLVNVLLDTQRLISRYADVVDDIYLSPLVQGQVKGLL